MASLPRAALVAALSLLGGLATVLAQPEPPSAQANPLCDVKTALPGAVTGAVGFGNPVGDVCDVVSGGALGAAGIITEPLGDLAGELRQSIFGQITVWVADGASWLLAEVATLTFASTSPDLLDEGFLRQYRKMAMIAVFAAALMALFAVLEAIARGDIGMLARVFLVNVPVAAIATSGAFVFVHLLLATTDGFCEAIASSTRGDTREFFESAIKGLAAAGGSLGEGGSAPADGLGPSTEAAGAAAAPLFVGFIAAIILSDTSPAQIAFTNTSSALLQGSWVRGSQTITWNTSELGSGLRFERARIDGAEINRIDYQAAGQCDTSFSQTNGEWARRYNPCPGGGPHARAIAFNTAALADGAHTLQTCAQDFAQYQGLNGTGSESCDTRTIRTDNTAPGAPLGLRVTSSNPARYLDRFGALFSLPPNQGSPIVKAHYEVIDASGRVVVAKKTLAGVNPSEIVDVSGPTAAGDYRLRVWLEDQVGLTGPAATAPIPRDTTPPAAPQSVSVTAPDTARTAQGFDVHWRNIVDAGAPIVGARYQVLAADGSVAVSTQGVNGQGIESIRDLTTPKERGPYTLRLWLVDGEGNVGAPASAPLAYDCVRSPVPNGLSLSAGLGEDGKDTMIVKEGRGATLGGHLRGAGGGVAEAPLCVFSNVITDSQREFRGIAMTGADGAYRFALGAGPSRGLRVIYRPGQRQLAAAATLHTRVARP